MKRFIFSKESLGNESGHLKLVLKFFLRILFLISQVMHYSQKKVTYTYY